MLEVKDLVIRYGPFLAVDSVDLQVKTNEIVGLIGPNGAGKSSIARALGGLIQPTDGHIIWSGRDITTTVPHERIRLGLSLVPEGRGLFPQMSVEENLLMGGHSISNSARKRELMDRCYQLFPILKDRRVQIAGTMSGGQQQMLAVSVGLMGDPKLCIFDEPSLGLAPIVIQHIGEALSAMRKLDLTVLLIEQNAKMTSTVADRIYVISAGRIEFHDTPQRLAANPEVLEKFLST
jgi:branched-chain amino acid transport system ATP-binding protein